ncbi:MAG: DoxX family protein [Deltaproteobacteria bacterium]|nr:DoxX family protein [Deltaproteobacteria bacterium]
MILDPTIAAIAGTTIAAIFLGSAVMKLWQPTEFRAAVESYRLVPEAMSAALGWIIPALELAGAIGLAVAATRGAAALVLLCLIVVFTGAIALNLARGRRDLDCGCFGPLLRQPLSGWLIARNGLLALLVLAAFTPVGGRPLASLDYLTIVAAAAALVILYGAANYLLATAPKVATLRMRDA